MRKIKVLQLPVRNTAGGITQYALNNWKYIDKERFQFDYVTWDAKLDYENELTAQGCRVHYMSYYAEDDHTQFIREFNSVLDVGYDAIHLHTSYWKSYIIEELAKAKNVPVVIIHSHNSELGGASVLVNREEALSWHNSQKVKFDPALATHFCACSRLAADWLFGPQIPQEKIQILANSIDVDKFALNPDLRASYRKKLGLENNYVIGHVGRFEYQKNHDFLIDVFAEVSTCNPGAKLMLIGVGALYNEIDLKVQDLGLADKVLFLGKRSDITELYQAMDLFALPSRFEGLPISMVEAQCSGLRCYTGDNITDEAKITENVRYLPIDVQIWSSEITRTMNTHYNRKDCSAEVAAAGYSIREQIRVLERIYAGEDNH